MGGVGGGGIPKSISKKSGGKSHNRGCSESTFNESRGSYGRMSTKNASVGVGLSALDWEECTGDDDDGYEDDGCRSIRALFEGFPTPLSVVVGAHLLPRLPAVSDSPRGGLDASVSALEGDRNANTCLRYFLTLGRGVLKANESILVQLPAYDF